MVCDRLRVWHWFAPCPVNTDIFQNIDYLFITHGVRVHGCVRAKNLIHLIADIFYNFYCTEKLEIGLIILFKSIKFLHSPSIACVHSQYRVVDSYMVVKYVHLCQFTSYSLLSCFSELLSYGSCVKYTVIWGLLTCNHELLMNKIWCLAICPVTMQMYY